ncbi:hypothetical protein [Nitrobacter sp.]|uniref:hypothetical protein n=1 Tax=Nitrobacter sp. TaxID=29420 RepID=UPI0029CAB921|nr:hypothetical protein [Nitrobacter sp.]
MAVLRALNVDHRRIAAQLDLEKHDVRVFSPKPREIILRRNIQCSNNRRIFVRRHWMAKRKP